MDLDILLDYLPSLGLLVLSGTIISVTVEVGYEVPGERVESLLLDAAEKTGLENGFVHMLELNDTSMTYHVSGLLEPVENLSSLRSQFTSAVVSRLQQGGIELVTPSVQYSRSADDERLRTTAVFSRWRLPWLVVSRTVTNRHRKSFA